MARASSLSPLFLSRGSSGQIAYPGQAGTLLLHLRMSQRIPESQNVRAGKYFSQSERAGHSCLRRKEFIQGRSLIVSARPWCGHRVPGTNKFSRSLFLRMAHNTRFATNRHINSNVHLCILQWERESISMTGLLTSLIWCQSIWRQTWSSEAYLAIRASEQREEDDFE